MLRRAERETHELALKFDSIQKETTEHENRLKVLRQLELAIHGLSPNDLCSHTRSLVQYDLVKITFFVGLMPYFRSVINFLMHWKGYDDERPLDA